MSGVVITAELQAALAAGAAAVLAVLGVVLFRRAAGYRDSRAINQQLVAVMFWFVSFSWAVSAVAIVIGLQGDSPDATVAATIVWTSAIARTAVIVIAASILVDVARHRRAPTRPAPGNVRPLPTDGRTSASAGARHHRPPSSEASS